MDLQVYKITVYCINNKMIYSMHGSTITTTKMIKSHKTQESDLAGLISASISVARCLRIIFLDCGMPSAVAIVSAVKDDSRTTRAP